jgi:hypothetical protein
MEAGAAVFRIFHPGTGEPIKKFVAGDCAVTERFLAATRRIPAHGQ